MVSAARLEVATAFVQAFLHMKLKLEGMVDCLAQALRDPSLQAASRNYLQEWING